jgi:hypothetical protein
MTKTTPDIAPRLVDNEPYCTGTECPAWKVQTLEVPNILGVKWTETRGYCYKGGTFPQAICIPGLRRQRDALQAERDAANDAYYMECRLRESTTAELDAARRELCEQAAENKRRMAGVIAWRGRDEADVRGWSYLYEKEVPRCTA